MSLTNQPAGNRSSILYAHTFQPAAAPLCRIQFVETVNGPDGRPRAVSVLPMVKWGDTIYIGAPEGTQFGFRVRNNYSHRIAPAYCEGRPDHTNTFVSEPEARTPADMWEVPSGGVALVSGFYDPTTRQLRPWQIVRGGSGYGTGESTFKTKAFNGLIDVYVRHEQVSRAQPRPSHLGSGNAGTYGGAASFGGDEMVPKAPTEESVVLGDHGASPMKGGDLGKGHAAIGAGAAQAHGHFDTGASYAPTSAVLVQVNFELDTELNAFLASRLGPMWRWVIPQPPTNWWEPAFSWLPASGGVASEIPVAPAPHRRRS